MWYAVLVKPHPKLRKTVKWSAAVVAVLLVIAWAESAVATVYLWDCGGKWMCLHFGGLVAGVDDQSGFVGRLGRTPGTFGVEWGFGAAWSAGGGYLGIPLWCPAAITLAACLIASRLDSLARRRERKHLCAKCGYDRRGLASDMVCPECGTL